MLYFEMGVNSVSILKFSKNFDFLKDFIPSTVQEFDAQLYQENLQTF